MLPNYRGSTGYGRAFREANWNDWGGQDYNDVMTGFTHMVGSGRAALNRVAHVGWSYGGYMSALALTKAKTTHKIDLQAVCTGGTLTDLVSMVGPSRFRGTPDCKRKRCVATATARIPHCR